MLTRWNRDVTRLKQPKRRLGGLALLLRSFDRPDEERRFIEKFRSAARKERIERSLLDFLPRKRSVLPPRSLEHSVESRKLRSSLPELPPHGVVLGQDLKPFQSKRILIGSKYHHSNQPSPQRLPPIDCQLDLSAPSPQSLHRVISKKPYEGRRVKAFRCSRGEQLRGWEVEEDLV